MLRKKKTRMRFISLILMVGMVFSLSVSATATSGTKYTISVLPETVPARSQFDGGTLDYDNGRIFTIRDSAQPYVVAYAYCISIETAFNVSYYLDYEKAGFDNVENDYYENVAEIRWILFNGFGVDGAPINHSDLDRTKEEAKASAMDSAYDVPGLTWQEAYAATQMALWHFSDNAEISASGNWDDNWGGHDGTRIHKLYYALIAEARANAHKSSNAPESAHLEINPSSAGATPIEDNKTQYGPYKIEVVYAGSHDLSNIDFSLHIFPKDAIGYTAPSSTVRIDEEFYIIAENTASPDEIRVTAHGILPSTTVMDEPMVFVANPGSGQSWDLSQAIVGAVSTTDDIDLLASFLIDTTTVPPTEPTPEPKPRPRPEPESEPEPEPEPELKPELDPEPEPEPQPEPELEPDSDADTQTDGGESIYLEEVAVPLDTIEPSDDLIPLSERIPHTADNNISTVMVFGLFLSGASISLLLAFRKRIERKL